MCQRISRDGLHFFNISQSSASEVQSITYILADLNYLPKERRGVKKLG
ncbi:four helix bundle protein [Gracilimonas sp.]